jgi:hypothetical protein
MKVAVAVVIAVLLGFSPALADDELPDTMDELLRQQERDRRWFLNPERQRLLQEADKEIKKREEKYRDEEAQKRRKKKEGWLNWW